MTIGKGIALVGEEVETMAIGRVWGERAPVGVDLAEVRERG